MRIPISALTFGAIVAGHLAAQDGTDRGAFLLRQGADTLVIERFDQHGDTVEGSLQVRGQPREDYVALLDAALNIRSLAISLYRDGAAEAPLQRVRLDVHGDSIFAEANGRTQRFGVPVGAMPLMNNSFALEELITRRARMRGASAVVPAWAITGGVTLTLGVTLVGADSIAINVAGTDERLRVDRAGRILGGAIPTQRIELLRVGSTAAATIRFGAIDYSAPAGAPYRAIDVTLKGQLGIPLGGTLTLPAGAGPFPAVITITGSGQQDRDEYIPVAGGYRPFRQIADTLGRRGIAVLRLDDRTVGASGGAIGTSADYADDIRAALTYLRGRNEIDGGRLALLGHSEGGMIAPMVAATDSLLRGIVLLAGPADRGIDIIHYQQTNGVEHDSTIPAARREAVLADARQQLDSIAQRDVWMRFFLSYDPIATARRVHVPVLLLQGSTDHQVTPDQAPKLVAAFRAAGDRDVTLQLFPGLDHLFLPDSSGQPSGYVTLTSNRIPAAVLGKIADWLVAHLAPGR